MVAVKTFSPLTLQIFTPGSVPVPHPAPPSPAVPSAGRGRSAGPPGGTRTPVVPRRGSAGGPRLCRSGGLRRSWSPAPQRPQCGLHGSARQRRLARGCCYLGGDWSFTYYEKHGVKSERALFIFSMLYFKYLIKKIFQWT